ncbi:MAG: type II toxin-antitoxin system RelE/ParE family toxin [Desulfosalsimonadaceae bacterium]
MKLIEFHGTSRKEIKKFPEPAKREAGHQLMRIQNGLAPSDWKPMPDIGQGVREIRLHYEGQFRIIYVARFDDAIHVLHAFQKKTQKTPAREIDIARRRYKEIKGVES